MNKNIPALLTTALLAIPGGALLAAGQVAQQTNPFEFNKELVTGIINLVGAFLLVALPIATQQILKSRSELKTLKTEVQTAKDESPTAEQMRKVQNEIGLLQTSLQTLKDDLRVTLLERDSAIKERDTLKTEKAALIEQYEAEGRQWEAQHSELKAEVALLTQRLNTREASDASVERFATRIFQDIEHLIKLAKMSTSERQTVDAGDLKPAT